jgi:glycosyltransferase involved in cell wall biosynthesis
LAAAKEGVTVVVPAFNEERGVAGVVRELRAFERSAGYPVEILVVDDGSTDRTVEALAAERGGGNHTLRVLRNESNRGYGYSLKRGINEAANGIVVLTDADGTYPNDRIMELVDRVRSGAAMAVGARSLASASVPLTRKPAKWLLSALANFLAGRRIPDLNSGLRAMRRDLALRFEPILPDGFSFTTTITLAAETNGLRVDYVPIEYARRTGSSKIRPLRDTANFFNLVVRTALYFRPMKVFLPLALVLYAVAVGIAFRDIRANILESGRPVIGDIATIVFLSGLQMLVIGFLADLANEAMRPRDEYRRFGWLKKLYENPLSFFIGSTVVMLGLFLFLLYRDKTILLRGPDGNPILGPNGDLLRGRSLTPKTLAVFIATLQFFSAGLLADLIQRRGRLR